MKEKQRKKRACIANTRAYLFGVFYRIALRTVHVIFTDVFLFDKLFQLKKMKKEI